MISLYCCIHQEQQTHLAADKERSKWQPTAVKKNADAQCLITPHLIMLEFIKSCRD